MTPAWNLNNSKVVIQIRARSGERDYEFPPETKLWDAVSKMARDFGLTAVNVTHDGMELSKQESQKPVKEFKGQLVVLQKDTGSLTNNNG